MDELAAMLRGKSAAEGTRQEALAMLREAQAVTHGGPENGRARRAVKPSREKKS
ncbi:MAG: hypothetical protein JO161_00760 [Planctomycetaceae bacterium]|nr:hypothetical protein [Planctomycetaceae bacterium]